VEVDTKWKLLLAQLAVDLLKLYNNMAFYSFHSFVSFEPFSEALKVDAAHCATAATRTDHWVKVLIMDI
jgi:hypothetical protein